MSNTVETKFVFHRASTELKSSLQAWFQTLLSQHEGNVSATFEEWKSQNTSDPAWIQNNIGANDAELISFDEAEGTLLSSWVYPHSYFVQLSKKISDMDENSFFSIYSSDDQREFFETAVYKNGEVVLRKVYDNSSENYNELRKNPNQIWNEFAKIVADFSAQ